MAKKREDSAVFEIVVVLAIVAIVALTGQMLLYFDKTGKSLSFGGEGLTGYAVSEEELEKNAAEDFLDIGVSSVEINPPSPVIGEPFEIKITLANEGFVEIKTPFYVKAELRVGEENAPSTALNKAVTQSLKPGEKTEIALNIAMVTKEGPLKIIATADSTAKLDDDNPSNNQRSKTVIISSQ
jgi:hypothetical protein